MDEDGLRALFRQFSFPGGIPSHVAPETPGSIHEGGELGYSLAHAVGAAFDNPDLLVACVVGDGEAETGPLATSWHGNKFLNPLIDGAVLPVLQLNGYKIANPTVLARIPEAELVSLLEGYGWRPIIVAGDEPMPVHQAFAAALDEALDEIREIRRAASEDGVTERPQWPMLVLRTPKGWTCPKEVDGLPVEGTWRAHQVPVTDVRDNPDHLRLLEDWMHSYRPEELFDDAGRPVPELRELPPRGEKRMSANPNANGGELLRDLALPDFRDYAVEVTAPGTTLSEATRVLGGFLRDVVAANEDDFRIFGPDETASNRLDAVFSATNKVWEAEIVPTDEHLAPTGRVVEVLSEHLCQGWLEGYLLTGRHGLFNCYEAFIHIVDSMFNQHAKWLKVTRQIPWRRPIASLNYLLSSHVWRQDHNGFTHQDPGFIDHVVNKKAEVIRVYLPPDANTLLSVADHCLRSRNYVNVIVAGKQPALNYLSMEEAVIHCTRGAGIWEWASNDRGTPDVVLGCCGDVPTLETLAAAALLREHLPELGVRVVNVVDLMRLQPDSEHPHGLSDDEFNALFTDRPPDRLRLPRLPVADPPAHVPPREPRQPARARLQGGRDDHDAVRHGHAERPRPLPSRDGRDRPRAGTVASPVRRTAPGHGATGASARGRTRASTARTTRRSGTGSGRTDRAAVLVVNAGSITLKLSLVDPDGETTKLASLAEAPDDLEAIAHRVVHGGSRFLEPVLIDDAVESELERVTELAPLHNTPALSAIREAPERVPATPPRRRLRHRLPRDNPERGVRPTRFPPGASELGIRRFGFHGLSVAVGERAGAGLTARRLPPRRRLLAHGGPRRELGRHDDGLHAARRGADGDPGRVDRSRSGPLPPPSSPDRGRPRPHAGARVGARRPVGPLR